MVHWVKSLASAPQPGKWMASNAEYAAEIVRFSRAHAAENASDLVHESHGLIRYVR